MYYLKGINRKRNKQNTTELSVHLRVVLSWPLKEQFDYSHLKTELSAEVIGKYYFKMKGTEKLLVYSKVHSPAVICVS